ncbi:hypothetical protein Tco_0602972 [Tanacetum coccineum]
MFLINWLRLGLRKKYRLSLKNDTPPRDKYTARESVVLDMALPPRDKRYQYLRFEGLQYTDADIADYETRLARIYRREVHRVQIPDKGDLSAYWIGISSIGDFLGTTPSYTLIMDLILRLCHKLIACSIAGRSQAPEKGLTVIMRHLPIIDMAKLVRLQICIELDDTWSWVALRPERQLDIVASAPKAAEDAPIADEGAQTMVQRLGKVEEDVLEIRGTLGKQRDILDSMACDFSQFSTWTVVGLLQMMSQDGVRYTSYGEF